MYKHLIIYKTAMCCEKIGTKDVECWCIQLKWLCLDAHAQIFACVFTRWIGKYAFRIAAWLALLFLSNTMSVMPVFRRSLCTAVNWLDNFTDKTGLNHHTLAKYCWICRGLYGHSHFCQAENCLLTWCFRRSLIFSSSYWNQR